MWSRITYATWEQIDLARGLLQTHLQIPPHPHNPTVALPLLPSKGNSCQVNKIFANHWEGYRTSGPIVNIVQPLKHKQFNFLCHTHHPINDDVASIAVTSAINQVGNHSHQSQSPCQANSVAYCLQPPHIYQTREGVGIMPTYCSLLITFNPPSMPNPARHDLWQTIISTWS